MLVRASICVFVGLERDASGFFLGYSRKNFEQKTRTTRTTRTTMHKINALRRKTNAYNELQNATFFYILYILLHFIYKYYKCSAFFKKCSFVIMLIIKHLGVC